MKKLKQSESRTTYFTWVYENNIQPETPKKLRSASSIGELGEIVVKPFGEPDKDVISLLQAEDWPLFSVEYNWEYREVLLSYYYDVTSSTNVYRSVLDKSNLVVRTRVFNVAEGTCGTLSYGNDNATEVECNVIPEQVLKCCYKEIRRMQGITEIFPYVMRVKISRTFLKTPFFELAVSYNKKICNLDLLEAITTYPYIPFVSLMLHKEYCMWEEYVNDVKELIENLDAMSPSSYKEFFRRLGVKPSIMFKYQILEHPDLASEYIHFIKADGTTDKGNLKYSLDYLHTGSLKALKKMMKKL